MLWSLMRKDLEQNCRALLLFGVSALALPLVVMFLNNDGDGSSTYAGIVFGYLAFSTPLLFGQWFIGQEKVKGTFRLLRVLPVPGRTLIKSKCLTSAALTMTLLTSVLVVEPAVCRLLGLDVSSPPAMAVVWMNLGAVFFTAVSITLFTVFDHKVAMQAIYWMVCGLAALAVLVEKYMGRLGIDFSGSLENLVSDWYLGYWGGVFVLLASALLIKVAGTVFERLEWNELEEN